MLKNLQFWGALASVALLNDMDCRPSPTVPWCPALSPDGLCHPLMSPIYLELRCLILYGQLSHPQTAILHVDALDGLYIVVPSCLGLLAVTAGGWGTLNPIQSRI